MSRNTPSREPPVQLRQATWDEYVKLRDDDAYRNIRMTFDRGSLELMSPTSFHERPKVFLTLCISAWAAESQLKIFCWGSTTFRREDLERGLEPDNCYYTQNFATILNHEEIDLLVDPPPDLALEVDITSSSIDRMAIYAAMGVPEIWRWHDDTLQIYHLSASGVYSAAETSWALPGFPVDLAVQFVLRRPVMDEVTFINEFRAACRAMKQ
jgi:Uma2 family endonuclease